MHEKNERQDPVFRLIRAFFPVRRMYIENFQKKQLNPSEMSALNLLEEAGGSMRVSELAAALHVTPPTVTQLITRLERNEMTTRINDLDDRRVVQVRLLEKGRNYIRNANAHIIRDFSGLYDALGEEDARKLTELLERVQVYFDQCYDKEGPHQC